MDSQAVWAEWPVVGRIEGDSERWWMTFRANRNSSQEPRSIEREAIGKHEEGRAAQEYEVSPLRSIARYSAAYPDPDQVFESLD